MYKDVISVLLVILTFGTVSYLLGPHTQIFGRPNVRHLSQVQKLFPQTAKEVDTLIEKTQKRVQDDLNLIYTVPYEKRTFDNTFKVLDRAIEYSTITQSSLYVLSITGQSQTLHTAAQKGFAKFQKFIIDMISHNIKLFAACCEYEKRLKDEAHEVLSQDKRYFLEETMQDFRRIGLALPKKIQDKVRALQKKRTELMLAYEETYTSCQEAVSVEKRELAGLEESFINSLPLNEKGSYTIPTTYDKFFTVMEQCSVSNTRKKLYRTFMQRGYPKNEAHVKKFISLSHQFARLLGYKSFAHYSLDEQMARTPEAVKKFLEAMHSKSVKKAQQEMQLVTQDLPEGVVLVDGKLQPWDLPYVFANYKKRHFQVDENTVAQYFPIKRTIAALFKLYEDFFGLSFKRLARVNLWHKDVFAMAVYKQGKYLGVLLLDLHPRPNKFSHAGQITVVPSVKESGQVLPAVVVVLANFTQEHKDRPAVITRHEVRTFFHECGHALHALLGSTQFASLSGTSTKADFVEMPSQMLEEWIWSPEILRTISSHHITRKPLPNELINKIIRTKNCDAGDGMLRQIFLADISLALYLPGADKDVAGLWRSLHEKWRPNLIFDTQNKGYCSFPHLMGYGPRYYGYLWSKVYALDLFSAIKPHGLRNKIVGDRYTQSIIAKGGSQDPAKLIASFLGREPSTDAFFTDLGFHPELGIKG